MGQFSWFTQDTHHRIIDGEEHTVYLVDDKGNKWKENCYDGYGVFGGKDFYELLAEMNGFSYKECGDDSGSITCPDGHKVISDRVTEEFRSIGIDLAFGRDDEGNCAYPCGDNPSIKWPSITESGIYYGGMPEADENQGFPFDEDNEEEFNRYFDGEEDYQ